MSTSKLVSILFYVAAAFDFAIGLLFLFAAPFIFATFKVIPPNHFGYVQFPALVLCIFAVMFYQIAKKPDFNRNLIPYGVMVKLSFAGVVIWHWIANHDVPSIWKPFAFVDIAFLIAMLWAMNAITKQNKPMQTY
jgi:hypothetical protein